ncbi:hypothetical protein QO200_00050 [Flavobacterium sp. Arc3]|uniref:hypothetical protein n=1 Tax=Flavobacterium sp. Arc3 TaxID=3046686 RepID=UPI00352D7935
MRILLFLLPYGTLVLVLFILMIMFSSEVYHVMGTQLPIVLLGILPIFPSIKISSLLNKKVQKSNIYKLTNLQVLTGTFELIIPVCLSFFLFEYVDKKESYGYGSNHEISDNIPYFLPALFFVILCLEWIRRYNSEKDKFVAFRYIYIIVMVIAFILSLKYIGLMFEPNAKR